MPAFTLPNSRWSSPIASETPCWAMQAFTSPSSRRSSAMASIRIVRSSSTSPSAAGASPAPGAWCATARTSPMAASRPVMASSWLRRIFSNSASNLSCRAMPALTLTSSRWSSAIVSTSPPPPAFGAWGPSARICPTAAAISAMASPWLRFTTSISAFNHSCCATPALTSSSSRLSTAIASSVRAALPRSTSSLGAAWRDWSCTSPMAASMRATDSTWPRLISSSSACCAAPAFTSLSSRWSAAIAHSALSRSSPLGAASGACRDWPCNSRMAASRWAMASPWPRRIPSNSASNHSRPTAFSTKWLKDSKLSEMRCCASCEIAFCSSNPLASSSRCAASRANLDLNSSTPSVKPMMLSAPGVCAARALAACSLRAPMSRCSSARAAKRWPSPPADCASASAISATTSLSSRTSPRKEDRPSSKSCLDSTTSCSQGSTA
mmetsp:Transcript_60853/g.175298  ORF Transcript_60853/g.175298 Transcript_60853/m.175298 type:complete len:438 (-) Transcript_60853:400-1713(-)